MVKRAQRAPVLPYLYDLDESANHLCFSFLICKLKVIIVCSSQYCVRVRVKNSALLHGKGSIKVCRHHYCIIVSSDHNAEKMEISNEEINTTSQIKGKTFIYATYKPLHFYYSVIKKNEL